MDTFQTIEYLVNIGHTDIGYVHTTEYISSWSERALGYRQALAQFRLPLSDDKVYRARYNGGNSYDDFCQVVASGAQLPTALVTDDDVIAVCVPHFVRAHVCKNSRRDISSRRLFAVSLTVQTAVR